MIYIEIAWGVLTISHVLMWFTIGNILKTEKSQKEINDHTLSATKTVVEGYDHLSQAVRKVADAVLILNEELSRKRP